MAPGVSADLVMSGLAWADMVSPRRWNYLQNHIRAKLNVWKQHSVSLGAILSVQGKVTGQHCGLRHLTCCWRSSGSRTRPRGRLVVWRVMVCTRQNSLHLWSSFQLYSLSACTWPDTAYHSHDTGLMSEWMGAVAFGQERLPVWPSCSAEAASSERSRSQVSTWVGEVQSQNAALQATLVPRRVCTFPLQKQLTWKTLEWLL